MEIPLMRLVSLFVTIALIAHCMVLMPLPTVSGPPEYSLLTMATLIPLTKMLLMLLMHLGWLCRLNLVMLIPLGVVVSIFPSWKLNKHCILINKASFMINFIKLHFSLYNAGDKIYVKK